MFRKILEFFKKLFGKQVTIQVVEPPSGDTEPVINSGDTVDVVDSGDTIVVSSGETEPVEKPTVNSKIRILIDNGHGSNTAGKRSPWSANKVPPEIEFYEYKWAREIAGRVVNNLKEIGYNAELIVTETTDISLTERANRVNKICNDIGARNVILVSIHSNAAGNGSKWMEGRGWEAYSTVGKTNSDKLAECLYAEAEKNFKNMKIRKDTTDGDSDKEANFSIIYKSLCPAVLTENFFYDNVDDLKYILSEEGKSAVVKTHVDGIINYIKTL